MVILTTAYNCEKYIGQCIDSIKSQSFTDFKCYILNDLSTDKTLQVVEESVGEDSRFVIINNQEKLYQPGNYDLVIRKMNIADDEICVEVDGDDWLAHSGVLDYINQTYENNDVWMTSGSFVYHNGRPGFANPPTTVENLRRLPFTLSHLRTWKSWLWKKINESDLKDVNGKYYPVAGDLSFMFPMLEMSGMEHFKFIPDILYVYNESNPLNDHKVSIQNVMKFVNIIRNKKPYSKLTE